VLDRWWPLLLPVAMTVVTAAAGVALSSRRDLGASMFAVRPGPAEAAPSLGTPFGLAFRLQRGNMIGWTASLSVAGLIFGGFADALLGALEDMPEVFQELFGAEEMLAGYLGYMALFMALLVGAYAVLAIQGVRTEETTGRAEPVLATPMSRWTWLGTNLAVIAAAVVLMMAVVGLVSGIGAAIVTGDAGHIGELTLAHLNQTPAVLVVLGVATLLFGVLPRAVPATWAIVGYGMFVGTFGPLMDLPAAALDLSPFEHPAELPLESFHLAPVLILLVIAAVTALIGLLGLRRRGINV
jgi:ABC-2 type transport system permease protein